MAELHEKMAEMVISGALNDIASAVHAALEAGEEAHGILEKGLLPAMEVVGQRMKTGEMYIPEVLRSAKTMQVGMDVLEPLLAESDKRGAGSVVIGTVQGDLHDIGKNLVVLMLQGAGFKVVDLGIDVKPQTFVEAVEKYQPDILGMSALLTTTMPKMRATIEAIQEAALRERVKILVGGAPVNQAFVDEIGADAYGANAAMAVEKARALRV